MVCFSSSDNESDPESGIGLAQSVPELDFIVTAWSQVVHQELKDTRYSETVINEIMELIGEPWGSGMMSENKKVSAPRVRISSEMGCWNLIRGLFKSPQLQSSAL